MSVAQILGNDGDRVAEVTLDGALVVSVLDSLVPTGYNFIALGYTGADLTTVTFKSGGSSGTIVGVLTLTYTAGVLQTVTRSA